MTRDIFSNTIVARMSAFNQITFKDYIKNLMQHIDGGMKIIMDNCSIHKGSDMKNLIKSEGHNFLFLPPYSPQINPIEELFSKWKGLLKSGNPNTKTSCYL